jgi:hypothetical protein
MPTFIDLEIARKFIQKAMSHYEKQSAPGWFTDWLDDLYIRLGENINAVPLEELVLLSRLHEEDGWTPQSLAVNTIYKMFDRLGRDTTGMISY